MAFKTLHLTNAYHPTSGGIRTFYRALLEQANDDRRPMRLLVPGEADTEEAVGAFGRLYTVRAKPAPAFNRHYRMIRPGAYLGAASRIASILEAEQPDLVEICDKYSLFYLAAMLRKQWLPAVARPTLVGLSCERMDDNTAAYLSRGCLARAGVGAYIRHLYGPPFDFHIANSEYTADELRRWLWDRPVDFVHTSPMGVEFQAFGPAFRDPSLRRHLLAECGGTKDSVLLLYAGRLAPEKNAGLLIDAMVHLQSAACGDGRDYRLVLAGDGPQADALTREAMRRAPGRVRWLGAIRDRRELARHYASADVFVHPNPREPFGIGPLEAMASRVPVVLPSAGGVLSYARADNAWLASPDGASFAFAIRTAATAPDPSRLAAAREVARQHDWRFIAARYFRLLDSLHQRRVTAARQSARPNPCHAPVETPQDFAVPTPVSNRIVTGLGHSA